MLIFPRHLFLMNLQLKRNIDAKLLVISTPFIIQTHIHHLCTVGINNSVVLVMYDAMELLKTSSSSVPARRIASGRTTSNTVQRFPLMPSHKELFIEPFCLQTNDKRVNSTANPFNLPNLSILRPSPASSLQELTFKDKLLHM